MTIRDLLQGQTDLMYQLLDNDSNQDDADTAELLEIVRAMLAAKADGLGAVIMNTLPDYIEGLKRTSKQYADAAKAAERSLQQVKDYTQFVMEEQGLTQLDGGDITIKLTNNSQPSVLIDDGVDQHRYANTDMITTKVEYVWDKAKLKEMASNDPESLPAGIRVVRGKHVRVSLRRK